MGITDGRHALGVRGEDLVCASLRARGFTILARNERVGRRELDIIARRGAMVVFCEVRARRSAAFVSPLATLDHKKLRRTREAAASWLRAHGLSRSAVRFDAAAVTFDGAEPTIDYRADAF